MNAQSTCLQKPEDLDPPLYSDTSRIVDPNSYEETVQVVDVYMHARESTITGRDTVIHFDPETFVETFKVTYTYSTQEIQADSIVTHGNSKIYYIRENDCLKISHISSHYPP